MGVLADGPTANLAVIWRWVPLAVRQDNTLKTIDVERVRPLGRFTGMFAGNAAEALSSAKLRCIFGRVRAEIVRWISAIVILIFSNV